MRRILFAVLLFVSITRSPAADAPPVVPAPPAGPQLLVIVSIDQFPTEYLIRFENRFAPGGFRRLMNEGAYFLECRHRHAETATAPGHATISTGAWASRHGIISNSWFDPAINDARYSVADVEFPQVGSFTGRRDRTKHTMGRSPRNLLADTIGDQIKIAGFGKGMVVSIALKDRSAILMGGHAGDEVYWFDSATGKFVTSFYYRSDVAPWVAHFNNLPFAERLGRKDEKKIVWNTLLPEKEYEHLPANSPKLKAPDGVGAKFPHELPKEPEIFKAIYTTPLGNDLVLNLVTAAVENERLGKRGALDLLCVGFSSNDPVGHAFGPHSREVMDTVLRTDLQIKTLLDLLDARVGKGKYVLALSSDHGVTPIHDRSADLGVSTGKFIPTKVREAGEQALAGAFGVAARPWIQGSQGSHLYLDRAQLAAKGIDTARAERVLADAVTGKPGVARVYTRSQLSAMPADPENGDDMPVLFARDFHPARSGDVLVQMQPFTSSSTTADSNPAVERPAANERPTGASHSSPYEPDQRIPLIIFGGNVPAGRHRVRCGVPDLAATVCELLGVPRPTACQGRVLEAVFAK